MNYFIKGRLQLTTAEQLAKFLDVQEELKTVPVLVGYASRQFRSTADPEIITYEARTADPVNARKVYNVFVDLMTEENVAGWAGWHECNHGELNEPCTWDEYFTGGAG